MARLKLPDFLAGIKGIMRYAFYRSVHAFTAIAMLLFCFSGFSRGLLSTWSIILLHYLRICLQKLKHHPTPTFI
jgi:cytochrome b subunit of formate dehydrogenase